MGKPSTKSKKHRNQGRSKGKKALPPPSASQPTLTQTGYVQYLEETSMEVNNNKRHAVSIQTNKTNTSIITPDRKRRAVILKVQEPPSCPSTPDVNDFTNQTEEKIPSDIEEEEAIKLAMVREDVERYQQDELLKQVEESVKYAATNEDVARHMEENQGTDDDSSDEEDPDEDPDEDGYGVVGVHEEEGTVQTYTSPLGKLEYVMPHMQYRDKGMITPQIKVVRPRFDKVFNTFYLFKDRKYNSQLHKIVNGVIREWRRGINEQCNKLDRMKDLPNRDIYRRQRDYAETKALYIQHSLATFDDFPVKILNMTWLKRMIPAVKTNEDAMFLYHMSNSKRFQLNAVWDRTRNEVSIITRFNNRHNVVFGT